MSSGTRAWVNDSENLRSDPTLSQDDTVGRAGLESFYDSSLRGVNGEDALYKNARGDLRAARSTAVHAGNDVHTSIDLGLATYLLCRLEQALTELGRNVRSALRSTHGNGEVLALVNIPGFDSSHVADY